MSGGSTIEELEDRLRQLSDEELAAQATGTLTEIVAPEGATIKVGGLLGRIGDGPAKAAPKSAAPIPLPNPPPQGGRE